MPALRVQIPQVEDRPTVDLAHQDSAVSQSIAEQQRALEERQKALDQRQQELAAKFGLTLGWDGFLSNCLTQNELKYYSSVVNIIRDFRQIFRR